MKQDRELAPCVVTPSDEKCDKYCSNGGCSGGRSCRGLSGHCPKLAMINLVLCVFLICNIIALYVLHFADRGNFTGDSKEMMDKDKFTLAGTSAQKGHAVSLASTGQVSVGAGTTAYLNAATVPQTTTTTWMDLFPIGTSQSSYASNILTYTYKEGTNKFSYVATIKVNDDKTVTISDAVKYGGTGGVLKRGATLSDTLIVFVTYDSTSFTNGLVLGTIAGGKVTINEASYVATVTDSASWTSVTRLSDTSFVMSYYGKYVSGGSWSNFVKVGTVSQGTITLGTAASFGEDSNGTSETTINSPQSIATDGTRFVVPWYISEYRKSSNAAGVAKGLCLSVFDVAGTKATAHGDPLCADQYHPDYMVASTTLTSDSFALAFHDAANNAALTILTLQLGGYDKIPFYRTKYVVDNTAGDFDFGNAYGFSPLMQLRALSGNRLAVVFQNPANRGKPSVLTLLYGNDLSLTLLSSPMPVTKPEFTICNTGSSQTGGSLYTDAVLTPNGLLVSYAGTLADGVLNGLPLVESLGKPLGMFTDVDGSDTKVAFTGVVSVSDTMTVGQSVYASTSGKVYAVAGNTNGGFVYADNNNVVLAKENMIGVAVDTNKVFVTGIQQ